MPVRGAPALVFAASKIWVGQVAASRGAHAQEAGDTSGCCGGQGVGPMGGDTWQATRSGVAWLLGHGQPAETGREHGSKRR